MIISVHQKRMLIISVIITVLFYGIISFSTDFNTIQHSFTTIGIWGAIIVFCLSFLNYTLRFFRWHRYINLTHKNNVPVLRHFIIYLSGFALTTSPAKAGETIRGVFLENYGIPFKTNIACFFSERVSDLLAILVLCLFGFTHYHDYDFILIIGLVLIFILIAFVLYPQIMMIFANFLNTDTKLYKICVHIYDILVQTKTYHKPMILCQSSIISIMAWTAEAYGFYYMIHILGFDINLYQAIFIYVIAMLIGGISFIPGGIGSSETVMIALLVSHDIPIATATAMTIFTRIATLWFAVIIGLICLVIQSYDTQKNIQKTTV